MFLGDVGSYAIGAWLAIAVVIGLRAGVAPVTMLAPVAVFLGDTATTIGRRAASGERWYSAHRSHAYQRLVIAGWSHTLATAFVAFVIAVTSVIGFSARDSGDVGQLLAAAGILVVITAYIATPAVVARRRSTPA